jgi:hypothetical protein
MKAISCLLLLLAGVSLGDYQLSFSTYLGGVGSCYEGGRGAGDVVVGRFQHTAATRAPGASRVSEREVIVHDMRGRPMAPPAGSRGSRALRPGVYPVPPDACGRAGTKVLFVE